MAFWFAVDLGNKRRLEQARAEFISLGGYESWDAYANRASRLPDEDNILKHPYFTQPKLNETIESAISIPGTDKAWFRKDSNDPRIPAIGTSLANDSLEAIWPKVLKQRNSSETLYLSALEALARGEIDIYQAEAMHSLEYVSTITSTSKLLRFHILCDFREGKIERPKAAIKELLKLSTELANRRNSDLMLNSLLAKNIKSLCLQTLVEGENYQDFSSAELRALEPLFKIPVRGLLRDICIESNQFYLELQSPEQVTNIDYSRLRPPSFDQGILSYMVICLNEQIKVFDQSQGEVTSSELISLGRATTRPALWPFTEEYDVAAGLSDPSAGYLLDILSENSASRVQWAILSYYSRNRAWPSKLAQLSPDYLETIPLNPRTGAPFDYILNARGNPEFKVKDEVWAVRSDTEREQLYQDTKAGRSRRSYP